MKLGGCSHYGNGAIFEAIFRQLRKVSCGVLEARKRNPDEDWRKIDQKACHWSSGNTPLELRKIDNDFNICKLANLDQVDFTREFVFLAKTPDEISLVCEATHTPPNTIECEPGWKALKISGPLDFGMIGIVAKISHILAADNISIFVVSTYNTDYIFLKAENFDKGIKILADNGYIIK